ncbi:MAG: hypothetical protein Q7S66_04165 [bacterium]|nr:hypothetical protein [bacterium]
MNTINTHKTGLALGAFVGLVHLIWSLLVAVGLAQPLVDFIFRLHFIQPLYTIQPFQFWMALGLVVLTSIIGYVIGFVLGKIWNWVNATA